MIPLCYQWRCGEACIFLSKKTGGILFFSNSVSSWSHKVKVFFKHHEISVYYFYSHEPWTVIKPKWQNPRIWSGDMFRWYSVSRSSLNLIPDPLYPNVSLQTCWDNGVRLNFVPQASDPYEMYLHICVNRPENAAKLESDHWRQMSRARLIGAAGSLFTLNRRCISLARDRKLQYKEKGTHMKRKENQLWARIPTKKLLEGDQR